MDNRAFDPFTILFDNISDYAIFLIDTKARISRWSSYAEKMFGYAPQEIEGQPVSRLHPAELEADPSIREDELAVAGAHGRFEDVSWRVRRDGSRFWADWVTCPLRDEQGQVQGFYQIVRDISERKKADDAIRRQEAELAQARKMEALGRLAGSVAHDFNNFIVGIRGLAEDVQMSMESQDPRREDLQEIIKASDQATTLTRQLLTLGRRVTVAPRVVDLNKRLTDKERTLSSLIGVDIQLVYELDPTLRRIVIDPLQLDQMLLNLVINARDAMPQGGTIRLTTRRIPEESRVLLTISDTGTGLDPRIREHLFEPFFTTKGPGKGTGLGLATVHAVVKQNHGHIAVQSRPGEGTTFLIEFPETDAPATVDSTSEIVAQ